MSLFGGGAKTPTVTAITGLQVQSSVANLPVPLLYGSPRIPLNLIYYNDFVATPVSSSGKGGKGLGGGKGGPTSYKYFATIVFALCEGPIGTVVIIYQNNNAYYYPFATMPSQFSIFGGAQGQSPWPFLVTNHPNDALGYTHTAYAAANNFPLDQSATVPQFNYVVEGNYCQTCPFWPYVIVADGNTNTYWFDADPSLAIYDLLTNVQYGVGFPVSLIDPSISSGPDSTNPAIGDAALMTYCQAIGFGFSVVLNNSEAASSIIGRWCQLIGVAPVWTGTTLKFIPYWGVPGNNPVYDPTLGIPKRYFTPITTPIFAFDDNDYVQMGLNEDPVTCERTDLIDVYNSVQVDYSDRYNQFNSTTAEARDDNAVEVTGFVRKQIVSGANEFTHAAYAAASAQIQLQRSIAIRRRYTFKLPWMYACLDPMDPLELNEPNLGLDFFPVRVVSIEEDDKGDLTFTVEEFPVASTQAVAYPKQDGVPPLTVITNVIPDPVNIPIIVEPTLDLQNAQGNPAQRLIIGVSGGAAGVMDPNWGGCIVYASTDNVQYKVIGQVFGPSKTGKLNLPIAQYGTLVGPDWRFSYVNPDNVHTLQVDMAESGTEIVTVNPADAARGDSLCVIQDADGSFEFLTYTNSALVGGSTYNLTGLYRGLYGSQPVNHFVGAKFLRIDPEAFSITLPSEFVNVPLYLKFQSFNVFLLEPQDLSTCTAYPYTPQGLAYDLPVHGIVTELSGGSPIDLNSTFDSKLDLNAGGTDVRAPILFQFDLGGLR